MPSIDDIVSGNASTEEVEIDFSGAVDFEPLPDGEYQAKVLKVEPGVSKEGNPKLVWTFAIFDPDKYAGRQQMLHTVLSGKGSGRTKQVIKAVGQDIEGEKIRFKPSSAVGKDVTLAIVRQKDNEDFNDIKKVSAPKVSASPLDS